MSDALARLSQIVSTLTRVFIAPASNMKLALALYATIGVLLMIILVIGIMLVMAAPEDEEADAVVAEKPKTVRKRPPATPPMSREARLLTGVGIAAIVLVVWVVAGFTTSDPGTCRSCHWPTSTHAKADKSQNPHARVNCVACHETGGAVGRYVTGVPFRSVHLALAWVRDSDESGYGQVSSSACASCHSESLSGTATNLKRGLKISHAEPLAASATCIDCHALRGGIVSVHNAGMKPCLRCHDDRKASSACSTCHSARAAAAVRARTTSFRNEQIKDVSCSGCHDEERDCDPCHGLRMPHSTEFKSGSHARAAAVDIWFNGGRDCRRCHTASRQPCNRCHTELMGTAHGKSSSMPYSHKRADSKTCNTCHMTLAYPVTRDFCKDVCHSPAAVAASPR